LVEAVAYAVITMLMGAPKTAIALVAIIML
jgi:hypothetical protein